MARRTKRPTVVWLPLDLANRVGVAPGNANLETQNSLSIIADIVGAPGGGKSVTIQAVVRDEPALVAGAAETLSDLEGSAYRLRRIVGKIWCSTPQQALVGTEPSTIVVTAGFIILRVDANGTPLNGLLSPTANQYDPSALGEIRDPWIWRRSWILGNSLSGQTDTGFPPTNAQYGSIQDGPHVDAKTARVVSDEERLFLVTTAVGLNGTGQDQAAYVVVTDLRVLASMRKQSGNRRNASR